MNSNRTLPPLVRYDRDRLVMENVLTVIRIVRGGGSARPGPATNVRSKLETIEATPDDDDVEGHEIKAWRQYLAYTAVLPRAVNRRPVAELLRAGLDPHNGSRGRFQRLLEAEEIHRAAEIRGRFDMYVATRGYMDTKPDFVRWAIICSKGLPRRYLKEFVVLVEQDWAAWVD
ncbi:hypothetical protein MMC27_006576 [Xylographa pallens]|nr:hypothetical protein [Xylographa pallens]